MLQISKQPVKQGTFKKALDSLEKLADAIQKELESLQKNDARDLVDLPRDDIILEGRCVMRSKRVFKCKIG